MRAGVVACLGVALCVAAALTPGLVRDRDGSRNVRAVATEVAARVKRAFTDELAVRYDVVALAPDLVPVPDAVNATVGAVKIPVDQPFFSDLLFVGALGANRPRVPP